MIGVPWNAQGSTGAPSSRAPPAPRPITDFDGFSAVAFHTGTATAADGTRFDLETDMRAYRGAYVDAAGTRRFGTFAFI
jgi:hypothetical protein